MLASGLLLVALLTCLTVMALMSVWRQKKLGGKLPPGPTPLPFLGNYLQLNTQQMYNSLMKLRERYGPVFTVHVGPRRIVVLCGHEVVKEALVDQAEEFSGRGEQATFDWLFKGYGVAFSNGERAKQLRRFSITTLRDFGVGKRGIEERIQEEAGFLIEALRDTRGAFIDPTFFLSRTVSNVISSIVFGDRFDYEDKEFLSLLRMMLGSFQFTATSMGQLYEMFYSVMKHLPGPQQQAFKELQGLEDFIAKKVEQNQRTLDPNSPRDFIDSFLIRMQEEQNNPNTEFYMKNLVLTTLNLFFAGTETVSTTLRYGFLLLMKHPDVEAKVHEEIDRVIGKNRQPKFEDRAKMPYTEAVIHEIQRFGDIIPMGVARRVTKDTGFREFLLPKGTEVFPMLGSVLRDPKFFSNPRGFHPQHFLDENGQFKKSDAFVPFSIGKRYCFGEGLARMELFLFLTNILQNFRFKSPQLPKDIDVSPKLVGFATIPRNYTMSFQPR
ncbi:cytochrome P450 2A13 isoform X2 [Ailuropoda melanoleuca]|uniref:Cytochrome P450 n=1 Tax=Ailuropoda melanoleuca TaxID=9646 RepID=A0A7N5J931_AILME|nr:cytochrome P450 2A13 isoform X1 [Ailuropoda melanoleuca]XP_034494678.1 cytochrome P450 2A13 isoform X2 [Ailuropoda melanoleuca]